MQKPVRQQCRKRRHRNDSSAGRAKIRSNANAENTNTGRIEKQQKKAGKAILPSPPACRRMRLYRRRAHLLAAQGGMIYIFPSIYEVRRNGNVFPEKFSRREHEFLNISHRENTEAQKGHRAAPDFSILAAWRHQGNVAAKIESYQKMKWYRENQEAAGNQATAEKPGGFGKAKGGGGPGRVPLRLYRKRDALFQGALPPKGFAAKGLRRQGAVPLPALAASF